jgi:hypothetical protein
LPWTSTSQSNSPLRSEPIRDALFHR